MKPHKHLRKQIDQLSAKLRKLEQDSVELLLAAVAFAHNDKDIEPLNEFVFLLTSLNGYTYSLYKIIDFLESNFQIYWSKYRNEFALKATASHITENRLRKFTVESVIDKICGDDIPYSEISFRRQQKSDDEKFMQALLAIDDSDDEYGPFGVPQDPRYNKYRIKIKRK